VAFSPVVLGSFRPSVVVIASSTGGPTALEQIFSVLNGRNVTVPILIAQHMPPHFTEALAKRLQTVSGIAAAEGRQGEEVIPGRIYVAPGDFHMSVTRLANSGKAIITLDQGPKRNSVRPAADCLFESAVRAYGGLVAGFVLTGMGEDGKDGAIAVKRAAGAIVIQDRASSVVWGMPGAVHAAGAFDGEGDLETCRDYLLKMVA
jgi:two-component system chemotaxis response regulator CheB